MKDSDVLSLFILSGEGSSSVSPLTPGDLLIALHNIDSSKCDMKSIIKGQCSVIKASGQNVNLAHSLNISFSVSEQQSVLQFVVTLMSP